MHVDVKGAFWIAGKACPSKADYRKFGNVRENIIFANIMPREIMILTNEHSRKIRIK